MTPISNGSVPEVNFPFIFSIDVSENPYLKSFKPGIKSTSYERNRDHQTFDSWAKQNWQMEEKPNIQDCVHNYFKSEGITHPIKLKFNLYHYSVNIVNNIVVLCCVYIVSYT